MPTARQSNDAHEEVKINGRAGVREERAQADPAGNPCKLLQVLVVLREGRRSTRVQETGKGEQPMLNEYEREQIRRAYYLEKQSIYRIAKDLGYSHQAVEKAIFDPLPKTYQLSRPKPAPVFGPYQPRVEALLQQNEQMPRK